MPKKYGVKEKDLVVAHVVNLILTGKLRSGDRVDRNEIAHELGVSAGCRFKRPSCNSSTTASCRPNTTAVRTSNASTNRVVREHHELYGMLSGIASARAAAEPGIPSICDNSTSLTRLDARQRRIARLSGIGLAVPRR